MIFVGDKISKRDKNFRLSYHIIQLMDGWMQLMPVDIDDMIDQNHAPLPNEREANNHSS